MRGVRNGWLQLVEHFPQVPCMGETEKEEGALGRSGREKERGCQEQGGRKKKGNEKKENNRKRKENVCIPHSFPDTSPFSSLPLIPSGGFMDS